MFQCNFYRLIRLIFIQVLLCILFLSAFRFFFLYQIADSATLLAYKNDLPLMAVRGFRFDLKVICIAFALPLLLGLITARSARYFTLFLRFSIVFSAFIYFLIALFSIVNFYYYQTYGNYIDVFIFGLLDDDTSAVIDNIWVDYPVLWGGGFSLLVSLFFTYLTNQSIDVEKQIIQKSHPYLTGLGVLLSIAIFFLFARGTLGSHPLKRYHANISDNAKLNIVTPNPFMALDWAKSDYDQQFKFRVVSPKELLASIEQVVKSDSLRQHTPVNSFLADNPPNVVVALMESMATSIMDEDDSANNDVLASLRPHFQKDFLFKRFYAETSDTIGTIVNMFVHSNVPNISRSTAAKVTMPDSVAIPFKDAGYETIFINAGNGMWRNLFNYLPLQGFDKVYDENSIAKAFPDAAVYASSWGVPDEFVFKFAQKIISESDKPVFICLLTVTNHSPYQAPENYQPKAVKASLILQEKTELSVDQQVQMLQTYQYGADFLGQFIREIKESQFADSTIIVSTGDHRLRSMKTLNNQDIARKSQVPFYLYVPQKILSNIDYKYSPTRVGSHKDIFPTLYNLSLSNATYTSLGGNNLLTQDDDKIFWGYSQEGLAFSDGFVLNNHPDQLLQWQGDGHLFEPRYQDNNKPPFTYQDVDRLRDLYINNEVTSN